MKLQLAASSEPPSYIFRINTPAGPAAGHWLIADLGVTAAHCMPGAKVGDPVEMVALDGPTFSGTVELIDELRDVLVIRIAISPNDAISRAATPVLAQRFDQWWTPYPHPVHQATLSGVVDDVRAKYQNHKGSEVRALQLSVSQRLPEYSGYSGAPVEIRDRPASSPAGMIVEEIPARPPASNGPNVLFALSVLDLQDVTASFGQLSVASGDVLDLPSSSASRLEEIENLRERAEHGLAISAVSLIDLALAEEIRRRDNEGEGDHNG